MQGSPIDKRATTMTENTAGVPDAKPDPAPNPPAPAGGAPREHPTPEGDALDPTRYGDWEKNGRCIDF